jgi:hypothetical protein
MFPEQPHNVLRESAPLRLGATDHRRLEVGRDADGAWLDFVAVCHLPLVIRRSLTGQANCEIGLGMRESQPVRNLGSTCGQP